MLNAEKLPSDILYLIWAGLWQGIGLEISFLFFWIGWHALYRRVAHKFDPDAFFHVIHDYFTK
jgi:hypothetical protein